MAALRCCGVSGWCLATRLAAESCRRLCAGSVLNDPVAPVALVSSEKVACGRGWVQMSVRGFELHELEEAEAVVRQSASAPLLVNVALP